MTQGPTKWAIGDLSDAMANAISQRADNRFMRRSGDVLKFNGFWRDGDKQNVCAWLDKATWHDAKTGEGGGCKEFAKVAFNLSLPEFMERFGHCSLFAPALDLKKILNMQSRPHKRVDEIWSHLEKDGCSGLAEEWLEKGRGFNSPRECIGSGFASLKNEDCILFEPHHHSFIKHRLSLGPQLVVPLRGVHSSKVQNLFFRAISDVSKNEKSRLLPDSGGWSGKDGAPHAFGFPHLIPEFPKLIICEGMADYFAAECLLGCGANILAIGAANAGALITWASWLSASKYKGEVKIIYQLDTDQSGRVSYSGIGQGKAIEALKTLLKNKISASFFNWAVFLKSIKAFEHKPKDIADICQIFGTKALSNQFIKTLSEAN